jgi:hypothetical protein
MNGALIRRPVFFVRPAGRRYSVAQVGRSVKLL